MTTTNRLAQESSPYLRQHADNPVDWYPWGEEAFTEARRANKPILLSVGYSACHWCHVMAHESFEDDATAAVINQLTVPVKVDREERPDVDAVYMEAVQAIAGGGGWPMTVFLLPDGRPFFGGTYYPRDRFVDLLRRVDEAFRTNREGLEGDAAQLAEMVEKGTGLPSLGWAADGDAAAGSGTAVVAEAAKGLVARLDREWGGFGGAPKFPQPGMLELLLQAWSAQPADDVLEAVTVTLDAMASGGIYDHLGGGFARYSTDRRWLVPHFEKMLYDNALLTRVYLHAWQVTGADRYRQVVTETVEYLLSAPMRQPGAAFSSAEDADSEGVEGRYYVWSLDEVVSAAGTEVADWYGVTAGGNWEGTNILWRPVRGDLARPAVIEAGRRALLGRRDERVRPGLDDKILTEWNAMAVAALAEAGAVLERPDWVAAAVQVAEFLLGSLRRPDGRWLRSWQAGSGARHLAYGADHAWLVEAFTRLAEATGEARWIAEARGAADALLALFWDDAEGGFHITGNDAEALIARPKDTYDGATPSTNSVATNALLRLAALTGSDRYRQRADRVLEVMAPALAKAPMAFTGMAAAAGLAAGTVEVAVTGDRPDLLAAARAPYRPERVLAWGEPYDSPLWEGRTGPEHAGLAFVCRNYTCAAPTGDAAVVASALGGPR
ncbi:thioredoxin domain-containing protein [Acidiferrimicrobium sp. IK]|uniref:thioredoxin domain-containing protein n=1 Tax=Acidiferrimicrobium sp. IK TaxID=2871700 RepID=UPI0021CB9525|nr:thioredoxin domain-containing protein [Acidiferrimicrobium sp. IK]MCU4183654.1 thioredoxin domain-containing protein [Acidiferrimicrobium sp. IK]